LVISWRVRRRKQLLDDLKEKRGYWKLKEEALDRTVWQTRFGWGCGPVVRQITEWGCGRVVRQAAEWGCGPVVRQAAEWGYGPVVRHYRMRMWTYRKTLQNEDVDLS
jgi:hypothetical protein